MHEEMLVWTVCTCFVMVCVWGWSLLGIPTGIQGEFSDSAAATLEGR